MSDLELYAFALRKDDKKSYVIPSNIAGIPVHKTPEQAESDARAFNRDHSECVILDIGSLVENGIIPKYRLFGSGIR